MSLITGCTIFVLVILCYGNLTQTYQKQKTNLQKTAPSHVIFLFAAGLIVVSTLRYGFIDTYAYKEMYLRSRDNLKYVASGAGWDIEEGWLRLLYYLNYISRSPKLMLFLSALIINGSLAKICKKYAEQPLFSLFLYYCLLFMDTNNGLRQMVAMAIVVLAFPLLEKKKYGWYVLCVILAYQLHNSAIVCLIIMLAVVGKTFNIRTKLAVLVGLVFLISPQIVTAYMSEVFADSQYSDYLDIVNGMSIWRALVTGVVPLVFVFLALHPKRKETLQCSKADSILINLTIINSLFVLMGTYMAYWNRFAFYTFYAPIVILPKLVKHTFGEKQYNKIIQPLMVVLYFVYFLYNVSVNQRYGALDKFYIEWWC